MAWLKIYAWEHQTYPVFQSMKLTRDEQVKFIGKFSRHFKVMEPGLSYSHRRGANAESNTWKGASGSYRIGYYQGQGRLQLGSVTTFGTFIHEFSHHLAWSRWAELGHGRKFKRELKRAYTFAKRYLPKSTEPVATL